MFVEIIYNITDFCCDDLEALYSNGVIVYADKLDEGAKGFYIDGFRPYKIHFCPCCGKAIIFAPKLQVQPEHK